MLSEPEARSAALQVLARHDGLAHLQRFLEAGLSRAQVGHLRRLGVLVRTRIGWYAAAHVPAAGLAAAGVGGVLGCTSAAAAWGIVVPERAGRVLHVSIVPGTTRLRRADDPTRRAHAGDEPDVRWHWEERRTPVRGWRVAPVDAILQMAECVEFRWLVAAIDSARCSAQRPALVTDRELPILRASLPERLRPAVDRSDPRSETSGETLVRLELEDRGVPFVPQQWLTTGYRPDGTVDEWLPIEVDGLDTHSGRDAVEQDRERDSTIAWFGTAPLRFTQSQAVRDTAFVGDVIERVWRRGAPPGLRGSAVPPRRADR